MTRMTGPDCAVMSNLINTHTHTHTQAGLRGCVQFKRYKHREQITGPDDKNVQNGDNLDAILETNTKKPVAPVVQ